MNLQNVIIGSHAFFVREGDTSTSPSGSVSKTLKPVADDASWIDFGILEKSSVDRSAEEKEVWKPSPGKLRLDDILETKEKIMLKFTVKQMSALMFELAFGTLALTTASTQYNPGEGTAKKGWLKLQHYADDDTIRNVTDVYVHLKLGGEVSFADDLVTFDVEATVLHSSLNTGTLS